MVLGLGGLGWPGVLRLGQLALGLSSEIVGLGLAELDQNKRTPNKKDKT